MTYFKPCVMDFLRFYIKFSSVLNTLFFDKKYFASRPHGGAPRRHAARVARGKKTIYWIYHYERTLKSRPLGSPTREGGDTKI